MPRPALELFHQHPIMHKHRVLMLDVSTCSQEDVERELPHITSGFTGILADLEQIEQSAALTRAKVPIVVKIGPQSVVEIDEVFARLKINNISAIHVPLLLRKTSNEDNTKELQAFIAQARKEKLCTLIQLHNSFDPKLNILMESYALRLSLDIKVDFFQSGASLTAQDLQAITRIVGGGNVLTSTEITSSLDIRRLLAAGASGLIINLEDLSNQKDPGQTAYTLGEAVFGPGSFVPK